MKDLKTILFFYIYTILLVWIIFYGFGIPFTLAKGSAVWASIVLVHLIKSIIFNKD